MASNLDPETGLPRTLRPGRYYTEAELAAAADATLKRRKLTQTAAAEALGLKRPHTVSMALKLDPDPDADDGRPYRLRYPNRGHKTRRAILRRWAGLAFGGDAPDARPDDPDAPHLDGPTHTAVRSAGDPE